MKRIILVCFTVLMTTGLVTVNAQTAISAGIKAEANMSNYFLAHMSDASSKMKFGPSLGGFVKVDLHENFAIQPEMMFFYRTSKFERGRLEDNIEQWGMYIPVYAVGQVNMDLGKAYIGIGPYAGFGFDAKLDKADVDLYKKVDGEKQMQRFDFGVGAMVGFEFKNRVQINARYQIGFIDQLDADKKDASMRNQMVSLGLGYRF